MVAEGIYGYESGAYFRNQTVPQVDQSFAKPTVDALRYLRLETFRELVVQDRAKPYLTPILAHGGIPRFCLPDFFTLLLHDLGRGVTDGKDLLTLWRTRKTRFQGIDKPAERFLLHGGELALDLIDRCIDLIREYWRTGVVPDALGFGLPVYVVEAFAKLPEKKPRSSSRQATTLPAPHLTLDPWDPRGPTLDLPPVAHSVQGVEWFVEGSEEPRRYPAAHGEPQVVLLRPARAWSCELRSGGIAARRTNFEGFDPIPAMFFDPTDGHALNVATGLRVEEAWILAPSDTVITATGADGGNLDLPSPQELPHPGGDWSGFSLKHVRLDHVATLSVIRPPDAKSHTVRVLSPVLRPQLVGTPVAGVVTDDGLPVYAVAPTVAVGTGSSAELEHWRIRLRRADQLQTVTAAELPSDGREIDISSLLAGDEPERVALVVQGPLGSDLRTAFAVVPGLRVQRPSAIFCPGDPPASATISAQAGVLVDGREAVEIELMAANDSDHIACNVRSSADPLNLRISVKRLLWGFTRSDDPATGLGARGVVLQADDLAEGVVKALLVRTGVSDVSLMLSLQGSQGQIQRSDYELASGADGRWIFDLSIFQDSVRASKESRLKYYLTVDGRTVPVAEIRTALNLGPITVLSRVEGTHTEVTFEFQEDRAMRNRVARLWSIDRPWEEPISEPIADNKTGSAQIAGFDRIPPGRYLAEVAIRDDWLLPSRPRTRSPNTIAAQIGTGRDWNARLRYLAEDDSPFAVLELAMATGVLSRSLDLANLGRVASSALDAACQLLEQDDEAASSPQFEAVCDLLFFNLPSLAQALVDDVSASKHKPLTLLLFSIETVHRARPLSQPLAEAIEEKGLMRLLWQSAPVLAAAMELEEGASSQQDARCDEFLGWAPDLAWDEIPTGGPVNQALVGIDAAQLEEIQRWMELVPQKILSFDALAAANFEWLLAEKRGSGKPGQCWSQSSWLIERLGRSSDLIERHLEAREPSKGSVDWAALPVATLAAAIHAVRPTEHRAAAAHTLRRVAAFAPRLVIRDLVLALALVRLEAFEDNTA
jgi:hypothetical protein